MFRFEKKTILFFLTLLINPFWGIGQIKDIEIGGIFEPYIGYRDYQDDFIFDTVNSGAEFIGLFTENGKFYLKPIYVDFEKRFDECINDTTMALIPNENHCIFLFSLFTGYNTAPIESVNDGKSIEMMPDINFNFSYNDIKYTFQADGEIDDSNIKNYSLCFLKTDCQTKQILVTHEIIESTVVSILFIGDLDGDEEPDIILNAPTNYENRRIIFFLSSTKKKNELLHFETEKFDWFDC